jgi:hypothetical protein
MEISNINSDLQKLYAELENVSKPIKDKINILRTKEDVEFKKKKEEEFNLIKGFSFYGDGSTWMGYSDLFILINSISCIDFGIYNSCNVFELKIRFDKKKFESLTFKKESIRVDQFKTHYKPLTPEILEKFKNLMGEELKNALSIFDINL